MQIPIENIYYLLCYAWNKLDEKDQIIVSIDDKTTLLDLLAKVLLNATKILIKRGIDRNYVDHLEEYLGVKGKIHLSHTIKRNLIFKQRAVCTFDDFSSNIISNQILISTIYCLTRIKELDNQIKNELIYLQRKLFNIDIIEISPSSFHQIKLNRNNQFYDFILKVCKLIYECILPSEEKGKYKFSDFTRDDKKMNQLFEAFVRNFYKIEQNTFKSISKEIIKWNFENLDNSMFNYLPQMQTDITLENEQEKIIIDAKFYRETMNLHYDKEKIKSNNLYQLFSYLLNQEGTDFKTLYATGILLYPTIEKDYDLSYRYKDHIIKIKTVNLNSNWKDIESRLKEIIN